MRNLPFRTGVSDRFKGNPAPGFVHFKPETEHQVRTRLLESRPELLEMEKAWKICRCTRVETHPAVYEEASGLAKKLVYSAKDIEDFCIVLASFQDEEGFLHKAGIFLSALINNSAEPEFTIHTAHLAVPIHYLGFYNKKKITIEGDAGNSLGYRMEDGYLTINGGAGHAVGQEMEGGSLTITGDAGYSVGLEMRNGTIIVDGNTGTMVGNMMRNGKISVGKDAGDNVGSNMLGGEIHIGGEIGSISRLFIEGRYSGKIYQRDVLIRPRKEVI
jgi:hypothetical protein